GYACLQALGADPLVWDQVANVESWRRPFATLGHATFLAAFLAMAVPLQLAIAGRAWVAGQRWVASVLGGCAALGCAAGVLTLSRGAWLALAVALAVLAVGAVRSGRRRWLFVGLLAGVPALAALVLAGLAVAGSPWVDPLTARLRALTSLTGRGP